MRISPKIKLRVAPTGPQGHNAFLYIAYASDNTGSDFTLTFNPSLGYIGIITTEVEIENPQASDFAGLWKSYSGTLWKGLYDESTTYYIGNLVNYLGSSYICIQTSTGNLPTDTDYWDIFSLSGGNNSFYDEVPSGDINGVNDVFTLTATPLYHILFLNGQRLTEGTDYSISGDTITMTTIPETGDILNTIYWVGGTGTTNADTVDGYHASDFIKQTDIPNATEKTTPVDADLIVLFDSASSFVLKKLSFLNLKLVITDWNNPVNTIREFYVDTNPATLLGVGTWSLLGAGRVTVCIDTGDTDFDTLGETRGAKTHTLDITEIPSHKHLVQNGVVYAGSGAVRADGSGGYNSWTNDVGGGQAHNNIQPSIVVYRWRRTA